MDLDHQDILDLDLDLVRGAVSVRGELSRVTAFDTSQLLLIFWVGVFYLLLLRVVWMCFSHSHPT